MKNYLTPSGIKGLGSAVGCRTLSPAFAFLALDRG